VTAPPSSVTNASLVTLGVNTGPDGDNDPQRTLATIVTNSDTTSTASSIDSAVPVAKGRAWKQRFEGLAGAAPTTSRVLYFSENNPLSQFFITADDATPTLFDPNNPPAIITTQGSVEDWTIQNQSLEVHTFHIHQVHFLVESQNNFEINGSHTNPAIQGQMLDTITLPFWDGNPNHPFPSVALRLDFRGADIGDFVYHCHIAEHEDHGMMAVIRVMPSQTAATIEKMRIRLISLGESLGLIEKPKATASAWCVRGRQVLRVAAR
jgi:hypothetical protein